MASEDGREFGPLAPLQRVQDLFVLGHRLAPALVRHVGEVAGAPDARGKGAVLGGEGRIVGGVQDRFVDLLVGSELFGEVSGAGMLDHGLMRGADAGELVLGDPLAGEFP